MTDNPIKQIYKFNKEAGLLEAGYSDRRECAFPIEEALEGFEGIDRTISFGLSDLEEYLGGLTSKELSRYIMKDIEIPYELTDVDRLDKHLDTIVFAFGSIFKLGLTPQQAMKALGIVMDANMQKLHAGKDDHGKQRKPDNFVGPEELLQQILDERE